MIFKKIAHPLIWKIKEKPPEDNNKRVLGEIVPYGTCLHDIRAEAILG